MSKTIQDIAKEFYEQFETVTRSDGSTAYVTKDGRSDDLYDLIYECHGDRMPNDTIFAFVRDALNGLSDAEGNSDDIADKISVMADFDTEIYDHKLLKWLADGNNDWCDEAQSEGLVRDDANIMERIRMGQWYQRTGIYHTVLHKLSVLADDSEE